MSCRTRGRTRASGRNGPSRFLILKVEAFWAFMWSVLGTLNWRSWADGTRGRRTSLKRKSANLSQESLAFSYSLQEREVGTGLRFVPSSVLSLGVEGYVEGVGSAYVEDALDCSCSSNSR